MTTQGLGPPNFRASTQENKGALMALVGGG